MRPEYSVVIPTFNRLDTLPEVLEGLARQAGAPSFEVVVVVDGSTDGTSPWLSSYQDSRLTLRCFHQLNSGPASARNLGVQESLGTTVAFLGDDTVPQAGWLAAHQAARGRLDSAQSEKSIGVIGYTGWHPRVRLTSFLEYINEYGPQFGYSLIEDPDDVPFNFFYTSNLSVERAALRREPFNSGFPHAAWEDIELSYRLKKDGFRLLYEPSARVSHDHPTDLARFSRRQKKAGFAAVVFFREHPELGGFLGLGPNGPPEMPSLLRQRILESLAYGLQTLPLRLPSLWNTVLRYYYIEGLREGWQAHH